METPLTTMMIIMMTSLLECGNRWVYFLYNFHRYVDQLECHLMRYSSFLVIVLKSCAK